MIHACGLKPLECDLQSALCLRHSIANSETEHSDYLFNILEIPSNSEESLELDGTIKLSDGLLLVVDCFDGVNGYCEAMLRRSLAERITPAVVMNKIDLIFLDFQLDFESAYIQFVASIDKLNQIISIYTDEALGNVELCPSRGNVAFSAGLYEWGFTISTFSRLYAKKFDLSEELMSERLWGNNYFDSSDKTWKDSGESSGRAFNMFVLDPLDKIFRACLNDQTDKLCHMLVSLNVSFPSDDLKLDAKSRLIRVMQSWLPAHTVFFEMMAQKLPSPVASQSYRAELLYLGPLNDCCGQGIMNCDPDAPLMFYVSKMINSSSKDRFHAFGRVFSGRLTVGAEIQIMGPGYFPGSKISSFPQLKGHIFILIRCKIWYLWAICAILMVSTNFLLKLAQFPHTKKLTQ